MANIFINNTLKDSCGGFKIKTNILKIISIFFIIFLLLNTNIYSSKEKKDEKSSNCYGLIVPLPQGENTENETFEDSAVRNMINDFLREKIDVFWISEEFNANCKKFYSNNEDFLFFEKGAFIVPFSEDDEKNILSIIIACDYNISSEIETREIQKSKIYLLMQPIALQGYKLKEVKIAQHLGDATRYSWPCYLQIADACGFLTYEFILDYETSKTLNNDDFNVFMWPYKPNPATMAEILKSLSDTKGMNTIRDFVKNGGGYIGSCYGASVASSGSLWPLPLVFFRRAYNENLKSFPFYSFAIADNWMRPYLDKENMYISTSRFTDKNHPLSYGLNETVQDFFNGAWFKWTGEKSQVISNHETLITKYGGTDVNPQLKRSLINTPSRVTTTFGQGKIVQFACHPEYVINIPVLFNNINWEGDPYHGRRTISNALFYATSEKMNSIDINTNVETSFIEEIIDKTKNIQISNNENHQLDEIKDKINNLKETILLIETNTIELKNKFVPFDNNYERLGSNNRNLKYIQFYNEIYQDYLNRSLTEIDLLEKIIPLSLNDNDSYQQIITDLKNTLEERIQDSEKYFSKIINMQENLLTILSKNKYNIVELNHLSNDRKIMINQYEIILKYVPQIHFSSLKTLRNSWYTIQCNYCM